MLRLRGDRWSRPMALQRRRVSSFTSDSGAALQAAYRLVLGVTTADAIRIAPEQAVAVTHAIAGYSVFLHLPTGAGKSLAFQVPALLAPHGATTLVVSPLIALMHDQVANLKRKGIDAALVSADTMRSTTTSKRTASSSLADLLANKRLVYSTPEFLLQNSEMRTWLQTLSDARRLNRIVVDEAHCVLEWGNSFRPSYLELSRWKARHFSDVPVTLATATVLDDDIYRLAELFHTQIIPSVGENKTTDLLSHASEMVLVQQLSDRPNLRLEVVHKPTTSTATHHSTAALIHSRAGSATSIVYCLTRREADDLCLALVRLGCHAGVYHGGIPRKRREFVRKQWMGGQLSLICATSAFGMGIDRSDVRFVVHHSLPLSLASYSQQIGRAGRDGKPATCLLLYAAEDKSTAHLITTERIDESDGALLSSGASHGDVEEVAAFAEATTCRRAHLAAHFGHETSTPCGRNCNCGPMEQADVWDDHEGDVTTVPEEMEKMKQEEKEEKEEDEMEPAQMEIEYYYQRVLAESKKQRLPKREALTRRAVREILRIQPTTVEEMAEIRGVGLKKAERYFYTFSFR